MLLLGTLGCTKKEDAPTPAVDTGSYKRNNLVVSVLARATATSIIQGSQTTDVLQIYIADTPQQQSDTQSVLLGFYKPAGQPNPAYSLAYINASYGFSYTASCPASSSAATLQETSPGVFSGTFSGTGSYGSIQTVVTAGVFTDARL